MRRTIMSRRVLFVPPSLRHAFSKYLHTKMYSKFTMKATMIESHSHIYPFIHPPLILSNYFSITHHPIVAIYYTLTLIVDSYKRSEIQTELKVSASGGLVHAQSTQCSMSVNPNISTRLVDMM